MSAVQVMAIRPLYGGLRSRLPATPWQLHCSPRYSPLGRHRIEILAVLSAQQRRYESTSKTTENRRNPEPQKPPTMKEILVIIRQLFNFRPLINAFRGTTIKKLYRQSPEELVLAIVLLSCISVMVLYVIYSYFHYFQSEQFTRYPDEIAKSLRRALYYTNYGPDPKLALKYYTKALEQCKEHGLDPFSDEVIGLRIQIAAWLEKIGKYHNAIEVLETLLRECQQWVETMDRAVREGKVDKSGKLIGAPPVVPKIEVKEDGSVVQIKEPENLWARRNRLLGKSVGISTKIGALYADEHVLEPDPAGERLQWSVETVLKELHRRQTEGVREGEGEWMTPEENGAAMEALANHYESRSQHYLAAPLYLRALSLSPPKSCHTAVLMNNLAISLAQQPVPLETAEESSVEAGSVNPERPTRAKLLASARQWALQAHATGSKIEGDERTPECDEACAVALCNLGEIAAMAGDVEEAKRRFKDSLAFSKRIAFRPGIQQAQDGLNAALLMQPKERPKESK